MERLQPSATTLVSRPFRHLCDLWLASALFVAVKAAPIGGVDKPTTWAFGVFAAALAAVWAIGRLSPVRRFLETLLDGSQSLNHTARGCIDGGPRTFATDANGLTSRYPRAWHWFMVGFMLAAGLLAFLEWRQPYYFVQDDNLSQFLPVVLQGCRSLLSDGVFPTWNPHQFLGSPTTSLGTYALTYPPTYVSYASARWVLGNEYATLDVFCILHLLGGYAATFWACRVIGVRPSLSATAGACFALAGFFLIAGRSWYYMTPVAAWTPLLVGLIEQFRRRPVGWKWVLATGGTLGILFHAGNAQMWAYAVLFYVIAVCILLICRAVAWSHVIPALAALAITGAVSAPLLVAQYAEAAGLPRRAGDGSMLRYLPTIFLPYPLATADFPGVDETPDFSHMGHMNYAGTVFSVAAALGMLALLAYRWNRRTVVLNLWLLLAWMAVLFTLGRMGGLWYLLAKIPPFTGFKHPFKFMAFATLFMVVGGALLLERGLQHWGVRRCWELALCAAAVLLIGYHVGMSTTSFCDYAFRPFPKLPADIRKLAEVQPPQRIYSIAPRRSLAPEYALSMMHQLPTVWGLHAFEGYDPLVQCAPHFVAINDKLFAPAAASGLRMELGLDEIGLGDEEDSLKAEDALKRAERDEHGFWGRSFRVDLPQALRALRAYGVRWVAVYAGPQNPQIAAGSDNEVFWKIDPVVEQLAEEVRERGRLVVHRPEVCIYELRGAAPLAFTPTKPRQQPPIEFDAGGWTVDLATMPEGGPLVVNVAATKFLTAKADGVPIDVRTDSWGRLLFEVPPGTQRLTANYRPPWLVGTLLGALLAGLAGVAMRYRNRLQSFVDRWLSRRAEVAEMVLVRFRRAA